MVSPASSNPGGCVLPPLAALDACPSSQLFILVLANLLSSFFDDAAHRPPSFSPLPILPTSAILPSLLRTLPCHPRNDHHRSRLKTLHRRIRCHQRGLPIASSRGARTCSGFPWRIQIIPGCPGTGHERKDVALTPVGENVLLRPGRNARKAHPSRRRCIFERSKTIKSSSFCCSIADTDHFPCRPSTTTSSVQEPRPSSHTAWRDSMVMPYTLGLSTGMLGNWFRRKAMLALQQSGADVLLPVTVQPRA